MSNFKFKGWEILPMLGSYFYGIEELAITIFVFSVFDFITGVWKSLKTGKPITSKKMRESVSKVITYSIALIVAFMAQKHILKDWPNIPFFQTVASFMAIVEIKSIFENLSIISGTNFIGLVKRLIKKKI